jgi:hypothetical protein
MKLATLAIICASYLACFAEDQVEKVREMYLGKEVTVADSVFRVAVEQAGRYQIVDSSRWISSTYKGQTATVIAVQQNDIQVSTPPKVNALGEPIEGPKLPLELEFVIKFPDGLIALRSDSLAGIKQWLILPEDVAAKKAAAEQRGEKSKQLIGKNVFATALSKAYRPETTIAEMSDDRGRLYPPQLVPLRIVAAKWSPELACAIVKLELPDGSYALSMASPEPQEHALFHDEIGCRTASLLGDVPSFLSSSEIRAIQNRKIALGISSLAVRYAIGYPDRENDWGRGGKQLVYKTGLRVYTDLDDKVIDWQLLSQ